MVSVTHRIDQVKQPRGGYVNPKQMQVHYVGGNSAPVNNKVENVHPSLMGLVVDYLSRLAIGSDPRMIFRVGLRGAMSLGMSTLSEALADVDSLTPGLVDADAILAACRLSSFSVYRAGIAYYRPDAVIVPDETTAAHIELMVNRARAFFEEHGPITLDGFTFPGGLTDIVTGGDGDFLTEDTLWDFKVSVAPPSNKRTLQLLMYYLMGKKSLHPEFQSVTHLGVSDGRQVHLRRAVTASSTWLGWCSLSAVGAVSE